MSDEANICGPLRPTGLKRARWRNTFFAAWLAQQPELRDRVAVVKAFDAFAGRSDLHLRRNDCTHYLYSPFAWRHVWDDIAVKLSE